MTKYMLYYLILISSVNIYFNCDYDSTNEIRGFTQQEPELILEKLLLNGLPAVMTTNQLVAKMGEPDEIIDDTDFINEYDFKGVFAYITWFYFQDRLSYQVINNMAYINEFHFTETNSISYRGFNFTKGTHYSSLEEAFPIAYADRWISDSDVYAINVATDLNGVMRLYFESGYLVYANFFHWK